MDRPRERVDLQNITNHVDPTSDSQQYAGVDIGGHASSLTEDALLPQSSANMTEEADEAGDEVDLSTLGLADQPIKKKKKKARGKKSYRRGEDQPTGFEEFFVDAPMTPEQHQEDQQVYDPIISFVDRILTAIQRFERTRKLVPQRRDVFYKYLAYGSIDIGPNMFQGLDPKATKDGDLDKDQIAAALAQTSISRDKYEIGTSNSLYAVDFTGCVSGFLSRRASDLFSMETQDAVKLITTTLERFFDYLLQHNVCPEYSADVLGAREICRRATIELWNLAESQRWLPGDFNIACSTLLSGQYARDYDGVTDWGPEHSERPTFIGLTQDSARQIMSLGIAGAAPEDVYQDFMQRVNDDSLEVLEKRTNEGFEITQIEPPSQECRNLYSSKSKSFRPVGRVHAKSWINPDSPPDDMTPEERQTAQHTPPTAQICHDSFLFLVDEVVQLKLSIGMKIEATLHKLNVGGSVTTAADGTTEPARHLWFFDELLKCYPSFDTFILNDMMVGWKEPKPLPGALDYVKDEAEDNQDDGLEQTPEVPIEDADNEEQVDGDGGTVSTI